MAEEEPFIQAPLGPFAKSLLGGLGTGIVSKVLGGITKPNAPRRPSGQFEGLRQKQYFSALYDDKLNPWELAGAGGAGEGGTAAPRIEGIEARGTLAQKQNIDQSMQAAQLQTQRDVATIGAQAKIESSKIEAGLTSPNDVPKGSKQDAEVDKLDKEFHNLIAQTNLAKAEKDKINKEIKLIAQDIKLREQDIGIQTDINRYKVALIWAEILGKGGAIGGGAILLRNILNTKQLKHLDSIGKIIGKKTPKGKPNVRLPHEDKSRLTRPNKYKPPDSLPDYKGLEGFK